MSHASTPRYLSSGIGMLKEFTSKCERVVSSRPIIIRNPQIWEFTLLSHLCWSARVLLHSAAHLALGAF
jgi:hypothetical protein